MLALLAAVLRWHFFRCFKPFAESGRPAEAPPPAVSERQRGLSYIKEGMRQAC